MTNNVYLTATGAQASILGLARGKGKKGNDQISEASNKIAESTIAMSRLLAQKENGERKVDNSV